MAVVQISKIQVRRGQKNSGIGVPQLSSAEFAWAVDTQELFIGNGSVAEGAPYVGNTRILTEHDNILELISGYRFAEDNPGIVTSTPRSLQSKLDEYVSVLDFGAVPDGSTDCVTAFENAFEDLFRNSDDKYKKVLFVPNGNYLFTSDLRIPGSAVIAGENFEKTIFEIGNNNIIFVAESGRTSNFTSSDRPEDIRISNITINHHDGETVITGATDCRFEKVQWISDYQLGDTVFVPKNAQGIYVIPTLNTGGYITVSGSGVSTTLTSNFATNSQNTIQAFVSLLNADNTFNNSFEAVTSDSAVIIKSLSSTALSTSISTAFSFTTLASSSAESIITVTPILSEFTDGSDSVSASVFWENEIFGTSVNDVIFSDCRFTQVPLAIECQQSDIFDTTVKFKGCLFSICDTGIYIGGVERQGNNWYIEDCTFEEISSQAFISTNGRGTIISRSRFFNCGNGQGNAANPEVAVIDFNESFGNVIKDCSFNRHQSASIVSQDTVAAVAEALNVSRADLIDRNYSEIYLSDSLRPLSVFSALNRYIYIDYTLSLGSIGTNIHTRTGTLTISIDSNLSTAAISDHYQYSAATPTSPGGTLMTNFEFDVALKDNDADSGIDTLVLYYRNPLGSGATGTISYSVSYGV